MSRIKALIAEERAQQHHVFAGRLEESLRTNGKGTGGAFRPLEEPTNQQVLEVAPEVTLDDLVLPSAVEQAVREVVEEQRRAEILRSYSIEPRHLMKSRWLYDARRMLRGHPLPCAPKLGERSISEGVEICVRIDNPA